MRKAVHMQMQARTQLFEDPAIRTEYSLISLLKLLLRTWDRLAFTLTLKMQKP